MNINDSILWQLKKFPGPYPPLYLELENIIKEYASIGREVTLPQAKSFGAMVETSAVKGEVGSIRGGIRVPHLHYADKIRILNEKDWATFSQKATAQLSAKIAKAKHVSFDQLNEIADATSGLM